MWTFACGRKIKERKKKSTLDWVHKAEEESDGGSRTAVRLTNSENYL